MEGDVEMESRRVEEGKHNTIHTHDIAPVVDNEVIAGQNHHLDTISKATKKEALQMWLRRSLGQYGCDVESLMWVAGGSLFLLVVFIIGLLLQAKINNVKVYNLRIEDKGISHMENIQIFDEVAMIWTPRHNGIVKCTTIHDFKTDWTGVHDETNNICFLRKLNRTDFSSLELLESLLKKGKRVVKASPVTDNAWTSRNGTQEEHNQLSFMLKWKCTGKGRPTFFMQRLDNPTQQNDTGLDPCREACLPHYALRKTDSDNTLHFDMRAVDCVQHVVC